MRSLPLIIVVGANDLALRVCEELCATRGHDVRLVWSADQTLEARAQRMGAVFVAAPPNDYAGLETAGVREAECIMPVSDDDRINLQIALKARDLNPQIRLVVRQFNRALGRKIEQNLKGCSAISPATHAAATFAAASIDPGSLYALQFPAVDGPLLTFSQRAARDFGLEKTTVAQAERALNARIAAVNGRVAPNGESPITPDDDVVICAPVKHLSRGPEPERGARPRRRTTIRDALRTTARLEPLLLYTLVFGTMLYFIASLYFMADLHLSLIEALYFVAATMFTVGYGDITPHTKHAGWLAYVAAIGVMGMGVVIGGVFIASISSLLNRAQETALRGLRQLHVDDHVVVCGAGNVGTRVIDFLLELGRPVVVIEPKPNASILELARSKRIDLMAADATDDNTLLFCNLGRAHSLVAVTDSDTANLEAALGALAHNARLPVVLRIGDIEFAHSIARNFAIAKSFATSELTAPVIAGLSRFASSRGRVAFAREVFAIGERTPDMYIPRSEGGIPLFFWREGELVPAYNFDDIRPGDRLLDIVPLSQFRAG